MKYELQSTQTFDRWFTGIRGTVRNQLLSRFDRIETGNFGDHKSLGAGLFELRCFFGGGLRVYYTIRRRQVVLLLVGGNKSGQSRDIEKAQTLLNIIEE